MKQDQHIEGLMSKHSQTTRNLNRRRLTTSLDCIRLVLKQGLPFRGHDEKIESSNQGNFLELLRWFAKRKNKVKRVVLENAPENDKMTCPSIQKEFVSAISLETTKAIIEDLGDELFDILVDESRDVSNKEQMAIVLRYVNKYGCIVERFLGIVHVTTTTSMSLKMAIDELFCKHSLTTSRIRGQGYDGASNMQGQFSGLKTLILRENLCAFYVHCFAHQLQLALIAIARDHLQVNSLFSVISTLTNVAGGSCKRTDMLRERQRICVKEALENGEIVSGRGLNQEPNMKRSVDTRWSSHFATLVNLILMYSSITDVLEMLRDDVSIKDGRGEAKSLLILMNTFDFALTLHLMKKILGFSNELSQALQRKDQDIVNAMNLVSIIKERLQALRDDGWEPLLEEGIIYRIELFYTVVDMQLGELNNRFNETNSRLLICMECLCPNNSFSKFDKAKLIEFAKFYPIEFSLTSLKLIDSQLETYIFEMRRSVEFASLKGISDLSKKMVALKKHIDYLLVYGLLKLAMILPVATSTVERAFSAMKIVKSRLRNRMGDDWMNDCLVTYIERDVADKIDDELIIQRFQKIAPRRGHL
ncbi:zinc finger MYM-type protein 1-like [Medicago truncatula]|uniref:zinc finger MYM-type protein 1-like n=1 Tax=Medicago truncatula TaxID=3880 RepID=UPI00196827EA|nr:zinc finger MYM-type protein 1-like [Medicago truncatula]